MVKGKCLKKLVKEALKNSLHVKNDSAKQYSVYLTAAEIVMLINSYNNMIRMASILDSEEDYNYLSRVQELKNYLDYHCIELE